MKKIVYCVISLMLLASAAYAEENLMTVLDTDQDGVISKEEAKPMPELAAQFEKLDVNKDGNIDAEELKAFKQSE